MSSPESTAPDLKALIGEQVVVDTKGPFVYIGMLTRVSPGTVTLSEVDVHDLRESVSSIDRYLIESVKHGVRVNRHSVQVLAREVVSISRLRDIVPY